MATSDSTNFNLTRSEIVGDALVHCGALEAGDTPSAEDSAFAVRQLNRMVKTWQADGVRLWTRREAYLFCEKSKAKYKIGPNSTDHTAELDDAVHTTLSADAASGASSITVASTTGIAVADNIGVVLDDDTIDWDTVSAIPGAITLTGTLTSAASSGNSVFAYTNKIARPMKIIDVQRTDASDVDTPILTVAHQEYQALPNKTNDGKTNEVYYQPERPDGFIHLWPRPETAADRLRMTCLFPLEDFDDTSNNPDFPQEWLDALTWNLAKLLIPSYGVPEVTANRIERFADQTYGAMLTTDQEPESVYFGLDYAMSE